MLKKLTKMSFVRRVHHSSGISGEALNFLFFICPRMKEPGIVVKNGVLTAQYVPGLSGFARVRIAKVQGFLGEMKEAGFEYTATAIFATADAFILFSTPVEPSSEIPLIQGMEVVPNHDIYLRKKDSFEEMLRRRPWDKVAYRVSEGQRLKQLLPSVPQTLKQEFVDRTFAGFALDGRLISEGLFGNNPVLLGVESPGVCMLQNAGATKPVSVIELE